MNVLPSFVVGERKRLMKLDRRKEVRDGGARVKELVKQKESKGALYTNARRVSVRTPLTSRDRRDRVNEPT